MNWILTLGGGLALAAYGVGAAVPDTTAKEIPSATPFPNYEIPNELRDWLENVIWSRLPIDLPEDDAIVSRLAENSPEYLKEVARISAKTDSIQNDLLRTEDGLTPGLFAVLNDHYQSNHDESVRRALQAIALRSDLTTEQRDSIYRHFRKTLDQPAPSKGTQRTLAEGADWAFMRTAPMVLARNPRADTEDLLIRALHRPNDEYVNSGAVRALAEMQSERGLREVRQFVANYQGGHHNLLWWTNALTGYEKVIAEKALSGRPSGSAFNPPGKPSTTLPEVAATPHPTEIRQSALLWLGAFALLAIGAVVWLWRRRHSR